MFNLKNFNAAQCKVLFLSSLGGMLEYYDFIIYIFLAPIIEKVFFAENSTYIATLKTLAIFSIGYFLRPLGGIVFSHFGDRYGRKVVFLLTIIFMAVPSFAIGLLPGTAQIGTAAPVLLLIFRMMQGLALGGELPAAITFVSEHSPVERRGFALSTLFFGVNLGLLLGSLMTTLVTSFFSNDNLLSIGWRIPFILGGIFGIASLFLRRQLHETALFAALRDIDKEKIPVLTVMREAWQNVLQGVFLVALGSVSVFLYLYWPQYLHQYMNYNFIELMRINTVSTLILTFSILLGGWAADKFGYRKVFLTGSFLVVLVTCPLFILLNAGSMTYVIMAYFIFSILFGFIPGSYTAILSHLFPTKIRYSGIALSYNLAYALFGGLSPLLCTLAIGLFDSVLAPAIYVIFVAALAGLACYLGSKKSLIPSLTSGHERLPLNQ